jgi:signal transduction histidine kinase
MSISNQIIKEKHGGSIECHSQPGSGTEFIIKIPVHQRNLSTQQPEAILAV